MRALVSPSILSADFNNLGTDIEMINKSVADYIHFDVMDGVFVPNISFGIPVIKHVKKIAQKPLDVHLMIVEPDKFIEPFVEAGASIITVHYEVCRHLHRTIQLIKSFGAKASVCLNPHTPVAVLEDIIGDLDMVLLMSVNPGFGGQQFIENTYKKVAQLRAMIDKTNADCIIEVDGGVNYETGKKLLDVGANVLVAGSFVFSADNPSEIISGLKSL
ncbi:ribulose-phosphate 3-epimerase [uncultured Draconibacterium sp.]|uniref:ribulose-phosphate 3-epimerase n=1 Tax=uncultured Draconibacterium sp. TaxID=1573823 RepID=UPI0029C0C3FF|nr:ribulose-phosphate 3-epimerase [uncultured Draconibacterium sp.]